MKLQLSKYLLGLIPLFALGLLRENFMLSLNFILSSKYSNQVIPNDLGLFQFLDQFAYMPLYYTKWIVQVFFSVLFCLLTFTILKYLIKAPLQFTHLILIYLASALIIIAIYFSGYLHVFRGETAHIARILLELQHSPLIYMILCLLIIFNHKFSA